MNQENNVKTCLEEYGAHGWITHNNDRTKTSTELCRYCFIRKEAWEGNDSDNTESKQGENKRKSLPQLFKPGQSGNPAGRPKGSKNMTTIVLEYMRSKKFKIKTDDGKYIEVDGDTAFADAMMYNALEKKDREALRMIWEFSDGKPTQGHKIEMGPRGYEISPDQEQKMKNEFNMYVDVNVIMPESTPHVSETDNSTIRPA